MSTFVLLHGAGDSAWYWHLVEPDLRAAGHGTVAMDLPVGDPKAGLNEYADAVVEAVGDRTGLVLVAQSMAGFVAPLAAARLPLEEIVLVAAMVPAEGETVGAWWENTGHSEARRAAETAAGRDPDAPFDPEVVFLHDVPRPLIEAAADLPHEQSDRPFEEGLAMPPWPDVPTRFALCRDDRFFPAAFQRRQARERLGLTADELPGGHCPALAHPHALAAYLLNGHRT
ncbi:alpha/beta hydrolase [Actinocorallia longicatena]|uniref:Alpha/beta fold hydrolase n=1 Tax=Actinocorallia longicatena TaxID=111803 RepID=A0ABP6QK00_9ACTN